MAFERKIMSDANEKILRTVAARGEAVFTIACKPFEHYCEFEVFEILSSEPITLWNLPSGSRPDPTDDLSKAERFLHGSIKWDGCSNWHFDIQDDCMIHFCSAQDAAAIGVLFAELYRIAGELIPGGIR
jgi:hypothetical protein